MAPVMIFVVSCVKSREKCSLLMYSSSVAFRIQGLWIEIQNQRYRTFLATDCHCVYLPVIVWGFRNSEKSLAGFRVPKFGKVFGWFWGSEIRKGLGSFWGFRNSERSLGSFASKKVFLILSEL